MTDEEFSARLEIRLRKHFRIDRYASEMIWQIVAELREIEREEQSKEKEHATRRKNSVFHDSI